MISHAVVLTSRRRAFPLRLLDKPVVEHLTVVAETGHPHRFPARGAGGGPTVEVVEVDDIRDTSEVRRAVWRAAADRPVERVLAPVEWAVATAGFLRSALGVPGDGFDVGLAFCDKYLMKRRLADAGLPTADFVRVFEPSQVLPQAERLGWPVIVKPTFGGACMDVTRVDDPQAAADWSDGPVGQRLRASEMPLVVEQYVRMDRELHIDAVLLDGTVGFAAVSAYFDPLLGRIDDFSGSWFLPREHPDHDEALALAIRAARTLGLRDGVIHVELFRSADGLRIGEAACRPAGGGIPDALRYQYGIDLWDVYWDVALGAVPDLTVTETPGIVVNADLPVRPGRVVELTTADELRAACPGLIELRMALAEGEVVSTDLNSSSTTGLLFYRARDEAELWATLRSVRSVYRLEVAPV